ncbi:MAG: hypothetical protein WC428_08050 [Candidatus Paceibacterota bacterium]
MSKEMMMCSHWETCDEHFCIRHKPHICGKDGDGTLCKPADWKKEKCNDACISYIPEQPKKPVGENHMLIELLRSAKCPNCDGSGEIIHQYPNGRTELEYCQWCAEKDILLEKKPVEPETWCCTECGHENEPERVECEKCGYPKDGHESLNIKPAEMPLITEDEIYALPHMNRYLQREDKAAKDFAKDPLYANESRLASETCSAALIGEKEGSRKQRDADMAYRQKKCEECLLKSVIEVADLTAHDSAVASAAVKEFAEKVIAELAELKICPLEKTCTKKPLHNPCTADMPHTHEDKWCPNRQSWSVGCPTCIPLVSDKVEAHIRAMAGKE